MVSSISLYFVVVNLNKKAIAIDAAADDVLPRLQRDPANGGPPRGRRQEPRPHREFAQLETRRSVAFGQVKKKQRTPTPSPKKSFSFLKFCGLRTVPRLFQNHHQTRNTFIFVVKTSWNSAPSIGCGDNETSFTVFFSSKNEETQKIVAFSQISFPLNGPETVPEPPPNEEHVHFCLQNELELSAIYWMRRQLEDSVRCFY